MVDFFTRFVNIVLPRVRDFGGIDLKSVDQSGVLNVGIKEHLVFPEINPDEVNYLFSLEASIVPRTRNRAEAISIYRDFGVPLKKN